MTGPREARRHAQQAHQTQQRSMGALRRAALAAGQSCVAGVAEEAADASRAQTILARLSDRRAQAGLCAALIAACAAVAAALARA